MVDLIYTDGGRYCEGIDPNCLHAVVELKEDDDVPLTQFLTNLFTRPLNQKIQNVPIYQSLKSTIDRRGIKNLV